MSVPSKILWYLILSSVRTFRKCFWEHFKIVGWTQCNARHSQHWRLTLASRQKLTITLKFSMKNRKPVLCLIQTCLTSCFCLFLTATSLTTLISVLFTSASPWDYMWAQLQSAERWSRAPPAGLSECNNTERVRHFKLILNSNQMPSVLLGLLRCHSTKQEECQTYCVQRSEECLCDHRLLRDD